MVVATWLAIFLAVPQTTRAEANSAENLLGGQRGLKRIGYYWVPPQELEIRQQLDSLPKLEKNIYKLSERVEAIRRKNAVLWQERLATKARVKQIERTLTEGSITGSQRKQLTKQLATQQDRLAVLKKQSIEPANLGGMPRVRHLLVRWTVRRQTLGLALLSLRREIPALNEKYRRLSNDEAVQKALDQIGPPQQLGPTKRYENELRHLAEYDSLAFTANVPLYKESGQMRVGAIVNDRVPATFTWRTSREPTMITTSLAQAAGIEIPRDAPRFKVHAGEGRRLWVRQTTISHLTLGNCRVRGVPALVLPPEGEDLGSQISATSLPHHHAIPEPELLRLVIQPAEAPQPVR